MHLNVHVSITGAALSSTCLALLDYINPTSSPLRPIKQAVKRTLNQVFGAPEIVHSMTTSARLDPIKRTILAHLRLWYHASQDNLGKHLIRVLPGYAPPRRLAILKNWLAAESITIDHEAMAIGEHTLRFAMGWKVLRGRLITMLKDADVARLCERRPLTFGGVGKTHWKAMRWFLASRDAHTASTGLRIWSGAAMTQHKRWVWGTQKGVCMEHWAKPWSIPCGNVPGWRKPSPNI